MVPGYWLSPDFSQCRLKEDADSFAIVWFTFRTTRTSASRTRQTITEVSGWRFACTYLVRGSSLILPAFGYYSICIPILAFLDLVLKSVQATFTT